MGTAIFSRTEEEIKTIKFNGGILDNVVYFYLPYESVEFNGFIDEQGNFECVFEGISFSGVGEENLGKFVKYLLSKNRKQAVLMSLTDFLQQKYKDFGVLYYLLSKYFFENENVVDRREISIVSKMSEEGHEFLFIVGDENEVAYEVQEYLNANGFSVEFLPRIGNIVGIYYDENKGMFRAFNGLFSLSSVMGIKDLLKFYEDRQKIVGFYLILTLILNEGFTFQFEKIEVE